MWSAASEGRGCVSVCSTAGIDTVASEYLATLIPNDWYTGGLKWLHYIFLFKSGFIFEY